MIRCETITARPNGFLTWKTFFSVLHSPQASAPASILKKKLHLSPLHRDVTLNRDKSLRADTKNGDLYNCGSGSLLLLQPHSLYLFSDNLTLKGAKTKCTFHC